MRGQYTVRGAASFALALSLALASGCQTDTSVPDLTKSAEAATIVGSSSGNLDVVAALPPPEGNVSSVDTIFANDLLSIDVFQVNELDRTVRVDSDGKVGLPLIGTVRAGGRTVSQFERDLERRYGANYIQNPEISVQVKESTGRRITMDGEFRKTGILVANAQTTLLRATAEAGGLTNLADEGRIFVYRNFGARTKVAQYSIAAIRAGNSGDPRLYSGDVIVAFTSSRKIATQNLKDALGVARGVTGLIPL